MTFFNRILRQFFCNRIRIFVQSIWPLYDAIVYGESYTIKSYMVFYMPRQVFCKFSIPRRLFCSKKKQSYTVRVVSYAKAVILHVSYVKAVILHNFKKPPKTRIWQIFDQNQAKVIQKLSKHHQNSIKNRLKHGFNRFLTKI